MFVQRLVIAFTLFVSVCRVLLSAQSPVIGDDVWVPLGANKCQIERAAERLLEVARYPAGMEVAPGACPDRVSQQGNSGQQLNLRGMTLDDALNRLIALAPSYEWRYVDGVVVLRPTTLWRDRSHFLDRPIGVFVLREATMGIALNELRTAIGPFDVRHAITPPVQTEDTLRPITLRLGEATGYSALNAIVRTHGGLVWKVSYCRSEALREFATFSLQTFDGYGVSGRQIMATPESRDVCLETGR